MIWKKISGKNISEKMASNLLKYRKTGPFKGFVSKNKKRFSACLKLESEAGHWKVAFDFDNSSSVSPKMREKMTDISDPSKSDFPEKSSLSSLFCPVCGGKIIEGKRGYGCSNWKPENGGCTFVIWKEIHSRKLTQKNIADFLAGKTLRVSVMRTPDGDTFKGKLKMEKKADGFMGVVIRGGEKKIDEGLNVILSFAGKG